MSKYRLLTPGPVAVPERVRLATVQTRLHQFNAQTINQTVRTAAVSLLVGLREALARATLAAFRSWAGRAVSPEGSSALAILATERAS